MSHVQRKSNIRVEATPLVSMFRNATEDEQVQGARSLVTQIRRHVDDFDSMYVVWDTTYHCEFCDYDLTDEPSDEPIDCCDKQVADFNRRRDAGA